MEVWDFRESQTCPSSLARSILGCAFLVLISCLCFYSTCAPGLILCLGSQEPLAAQQVPPGLRTEPNKRIPLTFQTGSENKSKALRNQSYVELQKVAPETLEPWSLVSGNPTHLPPTAQTEAAKTGSSFNSQPTFQNTVLYSLYRKAVSESDEAMPSLSTFSKTVVGPHRVCFPLPLDTGLQCLETPTS